MAKITRKAAANKIKESKGQFFTVVFKKRSDKSTRTMNCRMGVKKFLKNGKASYNAEDKKLITVYDTVAKSYKSIPTEGIKELRIGGNVYTVKK